MVRPSVSIILPFHREDNFLYETLNSLLDSQGVNIEILAVDNRASFRGKPLLYKDSRIKHIISEVNGYAENINVGVEFVTREFTGLMNSDDLVHPDKFYLQIRKLKETDSDLSICKMQKFKRKSLKRPLYGSFSQSRYFDWLNLFGFAQSNATWTWKTDKLDLPTPWRTDINHQFADWELLLRLEKIMRIHFLDETLYYYRQHRGQISKLNRLGHIDPSVLTAWKGLNRKYLDQELDDLTIQRLFVPWSTSEAPSEIELMQIKKLFKEFGKIFLPFLQKHEVSSLEKLFQRRILVIDKKPHLYPKSSLLLFGDLVFNASNREFSRYSG